VEAPSQAWKMVIVDNGSNDSTPAILESFKKRLPLETLAQPIAGKNRALNRGLSALEGRLAILTDDDAIPNSSFLTAWSKYLDKKLDYELFGGSIDPLFELPPPKWILRSKNQFDFMYAARDLDEGPIAADQIFGPNMAVRSSVFERGFRFKENIGADGSDPNYPMGDETEFCCRVALSGTKAWFAKEPRVQHIVRGYQLASSYWAKRAYQHGRGVAQQAWERGEPRRRGALLRLKLEQLSHLPQMASPSALQRFDGICGYHWRRGFRDEWIKRSAQIPSDMGQPVI
jgi:glycosyltransferase involved in cell wall biosynthesis